MQTTHPPSKGLVSRIQEELSKLNNKEITIPLENGRRQGTFHPEDTQMADKHTRRCTTSLATRGTQIKPPHYTPIRTTERDDSDDARRSRGSGNWTSHLLRVGISGKWNSHLGKQIAVPYKTKHAINIQPSNLLGIYSRERKTYVHMNNPSSFICNNQKPEMPQMSIKGE